MRIRTLWVRLSGKKLTVSGLVDDSGLDAKRRPYVSSDQTKGMTSEARSATDSMSSRAFCCNMKRLTPAATLSPI